MVRIMRYSYVSDRSCPFGDIHNMILASEQLSVGPTKDGGEILNGILSVRVWARIMVLNSDVVLP